MIEVVAVGVAVAIVGAASKGLAPLARMLGQDALGVRPSNQSGHPLLPDAYWDERLVPECVYGLSLLSAHLTWPHEGASFQVKVEFRYFIPPGRQRGIVYRTGWGALIEDERQRLEILRQVQQTVLRLYEQSTLNAIAQYKANLALAAIEKAWLDALEADKTRVIAELRAGRQAQFSRDWRAEAALGGNASTQQARKTALEQTLGNIEAVRQRLLQAAERAERERVEAVRQAAEAVESERQLQVWRDRQIAEAAAEQARKLKLSRPIPLAPSAAGAVFGTVVETGQDFVVPMKKLQHLLVAGVAGAGKSVFLHQIVWQLVQSADVERLVLIDLKGGVEFERYHDAGKVQVVWDFANVVTVIDGLMQLMRQRQDEMREKRLQNWPGGRVVVVIDEYAEIQSDIDAADGREEKATAKRLAGNLVSISRRARALGIVLVCALQKPTTDAMDSALRNNLSCRICLRSATSALAASMLDGLDDLPVSPTELRTGRFIYYDASRGVTLYLQAQIVPGIELAENL